MRNGIVIALAACAFLVAGLGWWAFGGGSAAVPLPPKLVARESSLAEEQRTSLDSIEEAREVESLEVGNAELPAENARRELAPLHEVDSPGCVLVGRVVDGDCRPLAGVSAAFRTRGSWSKAAQTAEVAWVVDGDERGLDGSTYATGEFRVEAPVPEAEVVSLRLELDAHHTVEDCDFGASSFGSRRPIVPGVNDLGTFTLLSAGSVWGNVVGENGQPIAGASVRVARSAARSIGVEGQTDGAGRYWIEHAPPGEFGVAVEAEGYLHRFESPVAIVSGVDVRGPDFVMTRAPTLEGFVVDERGRPISGVDVVCRAQILGARPARSRTGFSSHDAIAAQGVSDDHGAFTVYLQQDVPHRIEAMAYGRDPFTSEDAYPPGTRDIEIVLPPSPEVSLRVVDSKTNAPIELFDTLVERGDGWSPWSPRFAEHADGVVRLGARPGTDWIRIAAPGYRERRVPAREGERKVWLHRSPELVGRVFADGRPSPSPSILLERGSFDSSPWRGSGTWDGSPETRTQHRGEADGSFRIALPHAGGTYRVEIHGSTGAPLVLLPVKIPREGFLDLGDLELPIGAAIAGRIELPLEVPLSGFEIHVDEPSGAAERGWRPRPRYSRVGPFAITDENGEFLLENLPPGKRELTVQKEGVLDSHPFDLVEVDLADGERRSVVLTVDPTRLVCRLTVTVLSDGAPVQGITVSLEGLLPHALREGPPILWEGDTLSVLGQTDERGVVSEFVSIDVESRLVLSGEDNFRVAPSIPVFELEFGSPREFVVELDFGSLELSWRAAASFEPRTESSPGEDLGELGDVSAPLVEIGLSRDGQPEQVTWKRLHSLATRESDGQLFHVLELGPLAPGSYVVRVSETSVEWASNVELEEPPPAPGRFATAVVETGRVTSCRL